MRDLAAIRRAVANYIKTEGCSCCEDVEGHKAAKAVLAKLLDVPMYRDKSGYDFHRFARRRPSVAGTRQAREV
jgi:methionine aminopeptidase